MSRKTTKSILSRDEISLLRHSEELKNNELYGNLYEILCSLSDLNAIALDELIEHGLNDTGITILSHSKGRIIDNMMREWYVESKSAEDPNKKVRCGLCNTANKYLFYIRNRLNNEQLNVGSSCMKKFSDISGYADHKKQLNQIQRNQRETVRWLQFNDKFPEAENIISSANSYFNNLPILLPYDIYFPLRDVVNQLHIIHYKYIKYGKVSTDTTQNSFELFEHTLELYNNLKNQSDKFIEENINKSFMCKRPEIDWMLKQKKHSLLEQISQNNGKYTIETIGKVVSIDFVKTNFNSIQKALKSQEIILISPKGNQSNFRFLLRYGSDISYNIDIKKFMKSIGSYCIIHSHFRYNKQDLIKVSKISITNKNIEIVVDGLKTSMKKLSYALLTDERTHAIFLYQKSTKLVKEYSYKDFLNLYDINKIRTSVNDDDFIWFLIKTGKWIPLDVQRRRGIDGKINKLYYRQYVEPYKYS